MRCGYSCRMPFSNSASLRPHLTPSLITLPRALRRGTTQYPGKVRRGITPTVRFLERLCMNTKVLMTVSSLVLGLAGTFALFAPQELLAALSLPLTNPLSLVLQILGSLYLSLALTNWTAKDSAIGGIYARPTSLGNFAHFTIGALAIAKFLFTNEVNTPLLIALIVYIVFAGIFAWLVFVSSGVASQTNTQG